MNDTFIDKDNLDYLPNELQNTTVYKNEQCEMILSG